MKKFLFITIIIFMFFSEISIFELTEKNSSHASINIFSVSAGENLESSHILTKENLTSHEKKSFWYFVSIASASTREKFMLPDEISSWHSVSEHVMNITPTSTGENLGRVVYKNYVYSDEKSTLQIILTEGPGTGELYVPEKVNDTKGVMPSKAEYKIIIINGRKAILEKREYMPLALAVNLNQDTVITIETFALNEEEIVEFAKVFIGKIE